MSHDWKTLRIFVSSTFQDMNAERDHLVQVVFPELAERMAARRLHLHAVDLRWGVLAEEDSLQVCLDILRDSRPFFIGLLGNRYGSLPAPPRVLEVAQFEQLRAAPALSALERDRLEQLYLFDAFTEQRRLVDLPDPQAVAEARALLERAGLADAGHSITALEIFRGVLEAPPEERMISFFYVRDPRCTTRIPAPEWSRYNEADPGPAAKLRQLKRRLKPLGRTLYQPAWDTDRKTMVHLEAFGKRVLEDLWREIDARHPAAAAGEPDALRSEREAMEAMVETRLEHFVGRERLRYDLWQFARDRLGGSAGGGKGGGPPLLVVSGPPGSGKTALLARFYRDYAAEHPEQAVIAHFIGASPRSSSPAAMLARLWAELQEATGIGGAPPAGFEELVRGLPGLLRRAGEARPVLLVLDALNQLEAVHDSHRMRWLPETIPPGVAVVASALDGTPALAALRARIPPPPLLEVGALSRPEAEQLVAKYLEHQLRKLDARQVALLLDKPESLTPLYLLVALEELRAIGRYATLRTQIAGLPGNTAQLLQAVLGRLEQQLGVSLVRDFLCLVAVGRGGQHEEDLLAMLRPPGAAKLAELVWAQLFRSLSFYLLRRADTVDFYHQQLREAVAARYLDPVTERSYHRRSAEQLAARGYEYPRTLGELPYHLRAAGEAERLWSLLDDPDFRSRKLMAFGSAHPLCEDLGFALDAAEAHGNVAALARFGFHYSAYAEGRLGTRDLLELERRDPGAALREARMLRERPRFQALVLLAWCSALAGQRVAAEELIAEALLVEGAELNEAHLGWVAAATAALVAAGCARATAIPAAAFPPVMAVQAATRASAGLEVSAQTALLEAALDSLGKATLVVDVGEQLRDSFGSLARACAEISDTGRREGLLSRLETVLGSIRTLAQDAVTAQDPLALAMAAAIAMAGVMRGKGGSGSNTVHVLRAQLGAARIRAGDEARGVTLLEAAITGCAEGTGDSPSFGAITRVLYDLPESCRQTLFDRLVGHAQRASQYLRHEAMLSVITELPASALLERWAEQLWQSAFRLSPKDAARLAGLATRARAHAAPAPAAEAAPVRRAPRPVGLVPTLGLLAWNPLIRARHKFGLLRQQVELAALSGYRDPAWTGRWLLRLTRWAGRIPVESERATALGQMLTLGGRAGQPEVVLAVLRAVGRIGDPDLRGKSLVAALNAMPQVHTDARRAIWSAVLEHALRPDLGASAVPVWRGLISAQPEDGDAIGRIEQQAQQLGASRAATEAFALLAGAWARLGSIDAAQRAAQVAALTDQSCLVRGTLYAARAATAARGPEPASWREVAGAAATPDVRAAAELIAVAASGCAERSRVRLLERAVKRLPRIPGASRQKLEAGLAVAAAWARLGDPGRGARVARRQLAAYNRTPDAEQVERIVTTAALFGGHPQRAALLQDLVPWLSRSDPLAVWPSFHSVAQGMAALPSRRWKRAGLRRLYVLAVEREYISGWRRREAMAAIANALARGGAVEQAHGLASGIPLTPESKNAQGELLQPAAEAAARAALALAYGTVFRVSQNRDAFRAAREMARSAVEAAQRITSKQFRHEACAAAARAWEAVAGIDATLAEELFARAETMARALVAETSAELGWRWKGVAALAEAAARQDALPAALSLARSIEKDADREAVLLELLPASQRAGWDHVLELWHAMPSAEGRTRLAGRIAERALPLGVAPAVAAPALSESWWLPTQAQFNRRTLRALLSTVLLILGVSGGIIVGAWLALSRAGAAWPWVTGVLGVALLLAARSVAKDLRKSGPKKFKRIAYLVAIPLVPFYAGGWAWEWWRGQGPRWGSRLATLRLAWSRPVEGGPRPRWQGEAMARGYRGMLRGAAGESAAFDTLLGAYLARMEPAQVPLDQLPAFVLPEELSADLRDALRSEAEYRKEKNPFRRVARGVSKLSAGIGGRLTAAFFAPLMVGAELPGLYRKWRVSRLLRKGQALARRTPASAAPLLERAARLAGDVPNYWHDAALSLLEARQTERAIAAARRATELGGGHPSEPQFWYGLAFILWQSGRDAEAIPAFERVLQLLPRDNEFYREAEQGLSYCRSNLASRGPTLRVSRD